MSKPLPDKSLTPNPVGRPRNTEPHSSVSVWLPSNAHDKLIKMAQQQETSISCVVRSLLLVKLR